MGYAIYRTDTREYCRLDEAVILFGNIKEINAFMEEFAIFFANVEPESIQFVTPNILEGAMVIKYRDISDEQKAEAKQHLKEKMEAFKNE